VTARHALRLVARPFRHLQGQSPHASFLSRLAAPAPGSSCSLWTKRY